MLANYKASNLYKRRKSAGKTVFNYFDFLIILQLIQMKTAVVAPYHPAMLDHRQPIVPTCQLRLQVSYLTYTCLVFSGDSVQMKLLSLLLLLY